MSGENIDAQNPALHLVSGMEGIRVVGYREGLIDAYVDLDRIQREDIAVDQPHVDELEELFAEERRGRDGNTGQLIPILLAEIPSEAKLLIADGFHRTETLHRIGAAAAYASIKPNCTPEEVYDLRILASASHKSVQFARIGEWIASAWSSTDWASNVSVVQAFLLQSQPQEKRALTASRLGLTDSDLQNILNWTNEKCTQWKVPASTIHDNLVVAQRADPELVKQARHTRYSKGVLTPPQLKNIVKELPGEYTLQQIAAAAAVQRGLGPRETAALARTLAGARNISEATELLNSQGWSRQVPTTRKVRSLQVRRRDPSISTPEPSLRQVESAAQNSELLDIVVDDEVAIAGLYLALFKSRAHHRPASDLSAGKTMDVPTVALNNGQRALMREWLPQLTPLQRRALILGSCFKLSPNVIANVLGSDPQEIKDAVAGVGLIIQRKGA